MTSVRSAMLGAALVGALMLGAPRQAHATAIDGFVDSGTWLEFGFGGAGSSGTDCAFCTPSGGGNSTNAGTAPWTYTSLVATVITLTDAFQIGDTFEIFDFLVSLGTTAAPSGAGSFCSDTSNPACTSTDAAFSSGSFLVGPGAHSLTITAVNSPFGSGAAYFQVNSAAVPEPASLLLMGSGLLGAYWRGRRRA